MITRAGHHVAHVVPRGDALPSACEEGIDCVVAAGGDGTVASAGRMLAGGRVPLAILPLGTANNIAIALGIDADPESAVAAWSRQRVVNIDVGVVEDAGGHTYFIEGVGVGLIPAGIKASWRTGVDEGGDPEQRIVHARRRFLEALGHLRLGQHGVRVDGESIGAESLLVEVLNIATVGPRIRLSPEANPADGLLSVVVAGIADRDRITAHLQSRIDDEASHAQLASWRASRVELTGCDEYHVDDDVRSAGGRTLSVGIKPGFLPVLA
jgi:diacylglycerol kinase family enzyme